MSKISNSTKYLLGTYEIIATHDITPLTISELTNALSKKSKPTAADCDGVKYDMIKALPLQSLENVLIAMNKCFDKN